MGKFVILPHHTSNEFFYQFPNTLPYGNVEDCVEKIQHALTHDPQPLTEEIAFRFTWEAATERFVESSKISKKEALERIKSGTAKMDERIAWLHSETNKAGDQLCRLLRL